MNVGEGVGVELAILVLTLAWPSSTDGFCEGGDELCVPTVRGRIGSFASVDNGVCLGHEGFTEFWESVPELYSGGCWGSGCSAEEKRGADAHRVGYCDVGHVFWQHGVGQDEGAELARVVGAIRVTDLAGHDLHQAAEGCSSVLFESAGVGGVFVGQVGDAEDCGCNHHGGACRGVCPGVDGDKGWRLVIFHEFEQMGVVDVIRVEAELGFEFVSHGLVVEGGVRCHRSSCGWGHVAQEWGMVGPVVFWAGVGFEVGRRGGPFVDGVRVSESLRSALRCCPKGIYMYCFPEKRPNMPF